MNPTELASMVVRLLGDATSFQKMIDTAQDAVKGLATEAAKAVSKIDGLNNALKTFTKTGLGLLGTFGIATSLKGAFSKFANMEDSLIGLTAGIKANGGAVEEVMPKYEEWIGTITKMTLVSKLGATKILEQAEAMGFSGKAATQVATNAVALAKGNESTAASFVRVAAMMQRGHPEFAKRILGLQGITNKTELMIAIQKKLQTNMDMATAKAVSLNGMVDKLGRAFTELNLVMGEQIAQIVGPFLAGMTLAIRWFNNLGPEVRKTTAYVLLGAMAFLALAPAISTITYFLGPIIGLFSALASVISFVATSPLTLFVLAVAAATVAVTYFTDVGSAVLKWFGDQWTVLVGDVKGAMEGVANAIKAGDIGLTFDIIWTQVKLSFAKLTKDLRVLWAGFKVWLKESIIEAGTTIESKWGETTGAIARKLIELQEKLGKITAEQAEQMKQALGEINREEAKDLSFRKESMLNNARNEGMAEVKKIEDELKALQAHRDKLLEEAKEKAANVKPPKLEVPKLPPMKQDIKLIPKFDATAFASAEAISRIMAFKEKLQLQLEGKDTDEKGPKHFDAANASSAEATSRNQGAESILKEIRDILKDQGKKPGLPVIPAGLT